MDKIINRYLNKSALHLDSLIASDKKNILDAFIFIKEAFQRGNKLLICGNGGSASDSQHFAAELIGRYKKERPSMPAVALNTDTSGITAIGNDYGFSQIFSRQIEGIGLQGDILFAISTSGNSENIINAAISAKKKEIEVISLTGDFDSVLSRASNICIKAPSKETNYIQELHIIIIHILCVLLEQDIV